MRPERTGSPTAALSVPAYFALKTVVGLIMIKFSAQYLSVAGFAVFSQLFLLSNVLNLVAAGGVQNGLVRQVAVANNLSGVRNAHDGAFAIWLVAFILISVPVMLLRVPLSKLMTGADTVAAAIPAIALLSAACGPATIYDAMLAGRKRVIASMASQAAGLVIGGAGSLWFLWRGDATGGVMSFAAGSTITALIGWVLVRRMRMPARSSVATIAAEVRTLLGYSGAFVVTAATSSLVLLGLRAVYRAQFGVQTLSYWLVATRITDLNSQLTALFMLQIFMPSFASTDDQAVRRGIVVRCYAVAVAAMVASLLVFLLAPGFFIGTFLSNTYLGAKSAIIAYLAADCLRTSFYLLLQIALSKRQLWMAIALELGAAIMFAAIMLGSIPFFGSKAPYIAQITTQMSVTILAFGLFWLTRPTRGQRWPVRR